MHLYELVSYHTCQLIGPNERLSFDKLEIAKNALLLDLQLPLLLGLQVKRGEFLLFYLIVHVLLENLRIVGLFYIEWNIGK